MDVMLFLNVDRTCECWCQVRLPDSFTCPVDDRIMYIIKSHIFASASHPHPRYPATAPAQEAAGFDCSRDCADSCQQPDNCLRDAAQEQVQAFLNSTSLDAMLNLASDSLEQRTRARFERGTP